MSDKKPFWETGFGRFLSKAGETLPSMAGTILQAGAQAATGNIAGAIATVAGALKEKAGNDAQAATLLAELEAQRNGWELEMSKVEAEDRANARDRDVAFLAAGKRNVRADVMVGLAFLAIIVIAFLLAHGEISGDTAVGGFIMSIGGMFARNIGTAFDFEFGSSRSSREKDATIASMGR